MDEPRCQKITIRHVRTARIQIRLRESESSLDAFSIANDARFLRAVNEDSDQNA